MYRCPVMNHFSHHNAHKHKKRHLLKMSAKGSLDSCHSRHTNISPAVLLRFSIVLPKLSTLITTSHVTSFLASDCPDNDTYCLIVAFCLISEIRTIVNSQNHRRVQGRRQIQVQTGSLTMQHTGYMSVQKSNPIQSQVRILIRIIGGQVQGKTDGKTIWQSAEGGDLRQVLLIWMIRPERERWQEITI